MKVLLAGATGAIGRPLVTALRQAGHEVFAVTRARIAARGSAGRARSRWWPMCWIATRCSARWTASQPTR